MGDRESGRRGRPLPDLCDVPSESADLRAGGTMPVGATGTRRQLPSTSWARSACDTRRIPDRGAQREPTSAVRDPGRTCAATVAREADVSDIAELEVSGHQSWPDCSGPLMLPPDQGPSSEGPARSHRLIPGPAGNRVTLISWW